MSAWFSAAASLVVALAGETETRQAILLAIRAFHVRLGVVLAYLSLSQTTSCSMPEIMPALSTAGGRRESAMEPREGMSSS